MKTFKLFIFSGLLLLFLPLSTLGQNNGSMTDGIANATRSGDAARLAEYFNPRIELVLPGKSGIFSKEQAQFLLKDFLSNIHPPLSSLFTRESGKMLPLPLDVTTTTGVNTAFCFWLKTAMVKP